jgi:hypothetical protein
MDHDRRMMIRDHERDAARRIAEQLRPSAINGKDGRTWRKVTTLLSEFGYQRLTEEVRQRISLALQENGIRLEPPLDAVKRSDNVWLIIEGRDQTEYEERRWDPNAEIKVSVWERNCSFRAIGLDGAASVAGVRLFHVDPQGNPGAVYEALTRLCPGLTPELVEDLLSLDDFPKVTPLDPTEGIRSVSSFRVEALEEGKTGQVVEEISGTASGLLGFEVVEFVCGNDWLLVCWHPWQETGDGHVLVTTNEAEDKREIYERASARWRNRGFSTAGDLGVVILHELAASYPLAYHELYAWLDQWEQGLDHKGPDDDIEIKTLQLLRGLANAFKKRLHALNRPGMSRDPNHVWFPGVTVQGADEAELADDLIDRGLRNLQEYNGRLRSALELVNARRADREERHARNFQNTLTVIAGVLLVPTLIASVYGANTELPGRGSWSGLAILLGCMAVSAVLTYFVIRRWQRQREGQGASSDEAPSSASSLTARNIVRSRSSGSSRP